MAFIESGKVPGKSECVACIKASPEAQKKRSSMLKLVSLPFSVKVQEEFTEKDFALVLYEYFT